MRVVIVEDVISTGKTASALKRLVESMEGTVVGMVSLASRMMWTPNVPAYCNLIQIDDPPVRCDECPLCKQDVPHNTVLGHG
jgi:orotate phosphoribosyltransferase